MTSKNEGQGARVRKLSSAQVKMLRSAAAQPGGMITQDSPERQKGGIARTLAALLAQDLLRPVIRTKGIKQTADQDLRITAAGLQAIGLPDVMIGPVQATAEVPAGRSKAELILGLLRAPAGASIAEISAASSWQAHSVRGFLSATVRKKLGLAVASERDQAGTRRYRIEA